MVAPFCLAFEDRPSVAGLTASVRVQVASSSNRGLRLGWLAATTLLSRNRERAAFNHRCAAASPAKPAVGAGSAGGGGGEYFLASATHVAGALLKSISILVLGDFGDSATASNDDHDDVTYKSGSTSATSNSRSRSPGASPSRPPSVRPKLRNNTTGQKGTWSGRTGSERLTVESACDHLELLEVRQSAPFRRDSTSEHVGVSRALAKIKYLE